MIYIIISFGNREKEGQITICMDDYLTFYLFLEMSFNYVQCILQYVISLYLFLLIWRRIQGRLSKKKFVGGFIGKSGSYFLKQNFKLQPIST